MSRSKWDIPVAGRTAEETKTAVQKWFSEHNIKLVESKPDSIKGRWGHGYIAASKYFQVSFRPVEGGVIAQVEGWISPFEMGEQELSTGPWYTMGGIPRIEGWIATEKLLGALQAFSKKPSRFCPFCGQGVLAESANFCPNCGKPLTTK
jgi:hypothetical protein